MTTITFERGEVRVVTSEDGSREVQYVIPTVDGAVKAPLEWEAVVSDEVIAQHLAWLNRNGLLRPA